MSGVDGHSMTTIEDVGGDDGAQDPSGAEDNNAQPKPANAAGANRGAANPEDGGAGDENEGEVPVQDEGAEAGAEVEVDENGQPLAGDDVAAEGDGDPFDPKAFEENILKKIDERLKPAEAPKPVEFTEEQWAAKEQEFGVPRSAIQRFTGMAVQVHDRIMAAMDARFASIEKEGALRTLSRTKGFEDAQRYPKGIEHFLQKYDPKYHSNPELLKQAVVYARGLAASRNIQRVRVEKERHRTISGAARPASPGNGAGATRRPGAGVTRPLTREQRQVMEKFNMSEKEYRGLQNKGRVPVTDAQTVRS